MPAKESLSKKDPIPPLLRLSDVCRLLSLSRLTVRKLIETGELDAMDLHKFRRKQRLHLRVTRDSVLRFYEKKFGQPLSLTFVNLNPIT